MKAAAACALACGLLAAAAPCPAADDPAGPALYEKGRELFLRGTTPPCGVCHTLKQAGSQGVVGPVLDEIRPDARQVATALRNGIGAMPSFRAALTDDQIAALAWYVSQAAGQGKP